MWWKKDANKAYFDSLEIPADPQRLADVEKALAAQGHWEEAIEWRMSTVRTSRIECAEVDGVPAFRVTVECDHKFQCHCPTLERAMYFEQLYSRLISHLFYNVGWPSWADRRRLEPNEGERAAR
jgi:hypothetical protein